MAIDGQSLVGDFRVHLGQLPLGRIITNFITASVAVVMNSFSLVFIAYTDPNGDYFIAGVCSLRLLIVN